MGSVTGKDTTRDELVTRYRVIYLLTVCFVQQGRCRNKEHRHFQKKK